MEEQNSTPPLSKRNPLFAVAIPCIAGWLFTFCAIYGFKDYAVGLFIWLPFVMGISTTVLYGYKNDIKRSRLKDLSFLSLAIFCAGLLLFAMEGVICLIMAAPIGLLFNYIGHRIGCLFLKKMNGNPSAAIIILLLSVPSLMGFEHTIRVEGELRVVTTSVEINAPVETVWKNVISFPPLKNPEELIFRAGIAYPISGQIEGQGVGAIRHCNFSTGTFREPITVWDEPKLLKFNVDNQPEPLKELSFYNIHPNHLRGYWISRQGQFKLTQLPNGHTMLEGTTWYENKIKPNIYWILWSDYIVHKIHSRVLAHIQFQSEQRKE